jgi:xeroderma pigmentosum group C-complementing protein
MSSPYHLFYFQQRDDLEDEELHNHQLTEGMPTTIAGFKDHPLFVDLVRIFVGAFRLIEKFRYALTRHLRRDQVIDPPTELGKFRGEPVYPRSSVISLKTAENWMRQGRVIRQGAQPMKMVKQRAATVSRQREMELALERANVDGHAGPDEDVMQGLYARSQTELYKPEPIQNVCTLTLVFFFLAYVY